MAYFRGSKHGLSTHCIGTISAGSSLSCLKNAQQPCLWSMLVIQQTCRSISNRLPGFSENSQRSSHSLSVHTLHGSGAYRYSLCMGIRSVTHTVPQAYLEIEVAAQGYTYLYNLYSRPFWLFAIGCLPISVRVHNPDGLD